MSLLELPCKEWTRATRNGYGCLRVNGRTEYAHRWAYEGVHGPIPKDLELDHLCENRLCYEVTHLEAVTHQENLRRAGLAGTAKTNAEKAQCKWGHALPTERKGHGGTERVCRECANRANRELYWRKKGAA